MEVCVGNNSTARATVYEITRKPKSKYRPVAMDTVELEKLGVRKLRMTARNVLAAAEKLYTQGLISYPRYFTTINLLLISYFRTETNKFPPDLQLDDLIQLQTQSPDWGPFAAEILQRGNANPRNGSKSDAAHPPIHPLKPATK